MKAVFSFIGFLQRDLIITTLKVQYREPLAAYQTVQGFLSSWDGILVDHSVGIQSVVIDTHLQVPILLSHDDYGRSIGAFQLGDDLMVSELLQVMPDLPHLS